MYKKYAQTITDLEISSFVGPVANKLKSDKD